MSPSPNAGKILILLSLIMRCSKLFIDERGGRFTMQFYEMFSSTKAGEKAIYLGKIEILFLDTSNDLRVWNWDKQEGSSVNWLFLILSSCKSANITISLGIILISLLEKSIFEMGIQSHHFCPSISRSLILNNSGGNSLIYWPT